MVYSARPYRSSSGCYTSLLPAQEEKERTFHSKLSHAVLMLQYKTDIEGKECSAKQKSYLLTIVECCFKFLPFIYNDMLKWWENDAYFTA